MIFFQILAAILVAVLIVIGAAYLFYKVKIKGVIGACEVEPSSEPLIIHLNEGVDSDWLNEAAVAENMEELDKAGFQKGVPYEIFEMDDIRLIPYIKGPYSAVVYWHPAIGSWVDIVVKELSGKEITVSNAPMGASIDPRPESEKVFDSSMSCENIISSAAAIVGDHAESYSSIAVNEFREFFESSYKKDMAWKTRKGGISFDEFVNASKEGGVSYTDEQLREAFTRAKEIELYQWESAALEDYQKNHNMDDDKFYELENKLIVVPFSTSVDSFVDYLEDKCFLKENQVEKIKKTYSDETDILQLFKKLNGHLSPEIRAKHVADSDFPLRLSIYRLHDSMLS